MIMKKDMYAFVTPCSARPLIFDAEKCIGCNRCANICQVDILIPNPEKGKPPVVLYPGECYYCGRCNGLSKRRRNYFAASADESGQVCSGQKTRRSAALRSCCET